MRTGSRPTAPSMSSRVSSGSRARTTQATRPGPRPRDHQPGRPGRTGHRGPDRRGHGRGRLRDGRRGRRGSRAADRGGRGAGGVAGPGSGRRRRQRGRSPAPAPAAPAGHRPGHDRILEAAALRGRRHDPAELLRDRPAAHPGTPARRPAGRPARGQPLGGPGRGPPRVLPQRARRSPVVLDFTGARTRPGRGPVRHPAPDPGAHTRPIGTAVTEDLAVSPAETALRCEAILAEVERAVVGRRRALEMVLTGILAGGHVLIEDLPGLGKTLIARSFAQVLGLDFARIQFTPDLLPSDVIGAPLYDQRTAEMVFRPGPVFTQFLLADEINRTPPKTQSALLEAMGEGQVSADGQTRPVPQPFIVLATDNPIEYEGTYELPEAQLDRFLLRLRLGHLPPADETSMLQQRLDRRTDSAPLRPVTNAAELLAMRASLEEVEVSPDLLDYVVTIVGATRKDTQIQVGASPRGGLALVKLAPAQALLDHRDYVIPDDIKQIAVPALAHRVTLRPELWVRQVSADDVIARLLASVPTPRSDPAARADPAARPR